MRPDLASFFEFLLAFGALLGADLLALPLALLVALAAFQRFDDGRVLPAPLALQFGRVEQLALLVELVQFALLFLLAHAVQFLLALLARFHQLLGAQFPLATLRLLAFDLLLLAHLPPRLFRHLINSKNIELINFILNYI